MSASGLAGRFRVEAAHPRSDHFTAKETVFLAGSGYEVGERYAVIRDVRNPNRDDYLSRGTTSRLNQTRTSLCRVGPRQNRPH